MFYQKEVNLSRLLYSRMFIHWAWWPTPVVLALKREGRRIRTLDQKDHLWLHREFKYHWGM